MTMLFGADLTGLKTPTIPYPGGKARLAKTIVAMLPANGGVYVEPFAGRGNVFWAASTRLDYAGWWLNDIATAPFFEAIRDHGDTVRIPERSREAYRQQVANYRQSKSPKSLILEPYLTYGGGGYTRAGFGGKKSASATGYQTTIRNCHTILSVTDPKITDVDWKDMDLESLEHDDVVFIDPPYYDADVRAYSSKGFDYEALVQLLVNAKFKWILTEYYQTFYAKALGKPCREVGVQLASASFTTNGGKERRTECIWKNF